MLHPIVQSAFDSPKAQILEEMTTIKKFTAVLLAIVILASGCGVQEYRVPRHEQEYVDSKAEVPMPQNDIPPAAPAPSRTELADAGGMSF